MSKPNRNSIASINSYNTLSKQYKYSSGNSLKNNSLSKKINSRKNTHSTSRSTLSEYSPSKGFYPKYLQNASKYTKKTEINNLNNSVRQNHTLTQSHSSNKMNIKRQEINLNFTVNSTTNQKVKKSKINPINLEKAAKKLNLILSLNNPKSKPKYQIDSDDSESEEEMKNKYTMNKTDKINKEQGKEDMLDKLGKLELLMGKLGNKRTGDTPKSNDHLKSSNIQNSTSSLATTAITKWNENLEVDLKKSTDKITYSVDFILSYQNNDLSLNDDRLSRKALTHVANFNRCEKIMSNPKKENKNIPIEKKNIQKETIPEFHRKNSKESPLFDSNFKKESIAKWARMDVTKELNEAISNVSEIKSTLQIDTAKSDITSILNTLTVDNYPSVKNNILEILLKAEINQTKFVEVLFKKAINEKYYVNLYTKLCNEINEEIMKKTGSQKSLIKNKIIEKASQIFNICVSKENLSDPETEIKIKKYLIGNVTFIGELIKVKILPIKAGFTCLENLVQKYKKETYVKYKLLHLEAFIVMLDNFGKSIYLKGKETYTQHINFYIDEVLSKIINDKCLPGFLKYRAINLIEKRNNNWEDSLYEKFSVAKGKGQQSLLPERKETSQNKTNKKSKISSKNIKENLEEEKEDSNHLSEELSSDDDKK